MKTAVFCYSRTGIETAKRIKASLNDNDVVLYTMSRFEEPGFFPIQKSVYGIEFTGRDALIFVGACGIAVREIAPYVRDKRTDPAVICIDERANFVISLLSGHIGGANALAARLAGALGAMPVITTATDVNGRFSVDTWASEHNLAIGNMRLAKTVSAEILEHNIPLFSEAPVTGTLPGGIVAESTGKLGIYVGCRMLSQFEQTLYLAPRVLHVGIGCRRDTKKADIDFAIEAVFSENNLNPDAVCGAYSIDLKKDEAGLLQACSTKGWPVHFYSAQELQSVPGEFTASQFVRSVTGVDNVCERAALFNAERLIVKKYAANGVTVAVAEEKWEVHFG